jgi:hypothetical protein
VVYYWASKGNKALNKEAIMGKSNEFSKSYTKDVVRYVKHAFKAARLNKVAVLDYVKSGTDPKPYVEGGLHIDSRMPICVTVKAVGVPFLRDMSHLLKSSGSIGYERWSKSVLDNQFRFRLYPTRNAKDLHEMIFS